MPRLSKKRPPELKGETTDTLRADAQMAIRSIYDDLSLISSVPFLSGSLIPGVALSAGTTNVEHKLGKRYSGYLVVAGVVNGDYPGEGATSSPELYLPLVSTGAQTVTLWVW